MVDIWRRAMYGWHLLDSFIRMMPDLATAEDLLTVAVGCASPEADARVREDLKNPKSEASQLMMALLSAPNTTQEPSKEGLIEDVKAAPLAVLELFRGDSLDEPEAEINR